MIGPPWRATSPTLTEARRYLGYITPDIPILRATHPKYTPALSFCSVTELL